MPRFVLLFLLLSASTLAFYPSAPGTSAIDKARSFQSSLNRAVSQRDEKAIGKLVSDWMVYDRCNGPDGDKRTFTQTLLSEHKLGVVTRARDDGTFIHYDLNFGSKKMQYQIESKESARVPRLLILARDKSC